jgi:hypothetical protein
VPEPEGEMPFRSFAKAALAACAFLKTANAAQAGTMLICQQAQRLISLGTNMQACYYTATTPITPILVSFTVAEVQCMDDIGNDASLVVTSSGVSCVDVGYVEGKGYDTGGDNCVVNDSVWSLAYNTNGTGESGSTQAVLTYHVFTSDTYTLQNQVAGTDACGQAALCNATTYSWASGVGNGYVSRPAQVHGCR